MRGFLYSLIVMAGCAALTAAFLQIHRSEDLSELEAAQQKFRESGEMVSDFAMLLDTSVRNRDGILRVSETDFNAWAHAKIQGVQTGSLAKFLKFKRLWFDFQKHPDGNGRLKLVFERSEWGRPVTQSLALNIRRNGRDILINSEDVRAGRMTLPRNAGGLMSRTLEQVVARFQPEIKQLMLMNSFQFTDGEVILDPRLRRGPAEDITPPPRL